MERASVPTVSPFQRPNETLAGIEPGLPPINLALGEPRHGVPAFIAPVIAKSTADFGRYPAATALRSSTTRRRML